MRVKISTGGASVGGDPARYPANSPSPLVQSIGPNHYVARTALGKRLIELRKRAIKAGMTLASADEIAAEVARNRGELG